MLYIKFKAFLTKLRLVLHQPHQSAILDIDGLYAQFAVGFFFFIFFELWYQRIKNTWVEAEEGSGGRESEECSGAHFRGILGLRSMQTKHK